MRALRYVGELLRVAEQHEPAPGARDRQRVGERHLAGLVDEQHVDRPPHLLARPQPRRPRDEVDGLVLGGGNAAVSGEEVTRSVV